MRRQDLRDAELIVLRAHCGSVAPIRPVRSCTDDLRPMPDWTHTGVIATKNPYPVKKFGAP